MEGAPGDSRATSPPLPPPPKIAGASSREWETERTAVARTDLRMRLPKPKQLFRLRVILFQLTVRHRPIGDGRISRQFCRAVAGDGASPDVETIRLKTERQA